jgi:hypothetical protein
MELLDTTETFFFFVSGRLCVRRADSFLSKSVVTANTAAHGLAPRLNEPEQALEANVIPNSSLNLQRKPICPVNMLRNTLIYDQPTTNGI